MKITITQTCMYISHGGDFDVSFRYKGKRYYFHPDIEPANSEMLKMWITDEVKSLKKTRVKIKRGTYAKDSRGIFRKIAKKAKTEDYLAKNWSEISKWKKVKRCFEKGGEEFIVESNKSENLHIIPDIYLNRQRLTRKLIEKTILRYLQENYIRNPRIKMEVRWIIPA